jgi:hypothetical protein
MTIEIANFWLGFGLGLLFMFLFISVMAYIVTKEKPEMIK